MNVLPANVRNRYCCASSSALRAATCASSATMSSLVARASRNISSRSSLTWCFTYSKSAFTLPSKISPSCGTPSICAMRSFALACSPVASGANSLFFSGHLTAGQKISSSTCACAPNSAQIFAPSSLSDSRVTGCKMRNSFFATVSSGRRVASGQTKR